MYRRGSAKSSLEKELSAKLTEDGCRRQFDNNRLAAKTYCGTAA